MGGNAFAIASLNSDDDMQIEVRADLEKLDMQEITPLMSACLDGHARIARALCEAGAQVDQTEGDGATALMLATLIGFDLVAH